MTPIEELDLILNLIRKYGLPLSPILEYAVNEKKDELKDSTTPESTIVEQIPVIPEEESKKELQPTKNIDLEINHKEQTVVEPSEACISVTADIIEKARKITGFLSKEQLSAIGVGWPPPIGWARSAIGKKITQKQYNQLNLIKDTETETESESQNDNVVDSSRISSNDSPLSSVDLERIAAITKALNSFSFPATPQDIARTVSRSAWGGSVKESLVLALLRKMPQVEKIGANHYFIKKTN